MGRLFFILLLGAIIYYILKLLFPPAKNRQSWDNNEGVINSMVLDPNCSTYIPKTGAIRKRLEGKDCYFCSKECQKAYQEKSAGKAH